MDEIKVEIGMQLVKLHHVSASIPVIGTYCTQSQSQQR